MQSSFIRVCVLALFAAAALSAKATVAQVEKTPKATTPAKSNTEPKTDQSDKQKPSPKVTISKETTYITKPLRDDGYPDYIRYFNEKLSAGVTPDNNATVLLLRAMGPVDIPDETSADFFKRLDIEPLPAEGDYFVTWFTYSKRFSDKDRPSVPAGVQQTAQEYFESLDEVARRRPWTRDQFPQLAQWLADNDQKIDVLVTASKRPRMYTPLIIDDSKQTLIQALLPVAQPSRQAARTLVTRAMYRAGNGDIDGAVRDLIACHRLARLTSQGLSLLETLVAIAMEHIALDAEAALLAEEKLTGKGRALLRMEFDRLPPMRSMADVLDQGERLMYVDIVSGMARGLIDTNQGLDPSTPSAAMARALIEQTWGNAIDWDIPLKVGNEWYDKLVEIARIKDRKEQLERFQKFEKDLKALAPTTSSPKLIVSAILAPRATASQHIANALLLLLLPAMDAALDAEHRNEAKHTLVKLGLALADYRDQHKQFPGKLDDLTPKYFNTTPLDPMWGEPFVYKKTDDGYLLYGLGPNGQDDGGRDSDANDGADDLVIAIQSKP